MASNTGGAKTTKHNSATKPLDKTTTVTITALTLTRLAGGAACLIAPIPVAKLFRIPLPSATAAVTAGLALPLRLFAVRDLALGALVHTADRDGGNNNSGNDRRGELRRVLTAGVVSDVADLGATAVALYTGVITRTGAGLLGGGVVVALLLGVEGLIGLRKADAGAPSVKL